MQLTKHHGVGNDFLVLVDPGRRFTVDEVLARALCDRHTGIGADGIMHATPAAAASRADVAMLLRNADGSAAEMSGNGIRCFVQAVLAAGVAAGPVVRVATGAGLRAVEVLDQPDSRTIVARVGMGRLVEAPSPAEIEPEPLKALAVDAGNPHLVRLLADRGAVDADVAGFAKPDVNVEHVCVGPEADALTMRVVERGVGETLACGTGACAAAFAGRAWGLTGNRVTVHMPGGDVVVELAGDEATLTGPAALIATIEVPDA